MHMDEAGLLRAIFTSATDYGIITLDNAGHVMTWNVGAERITGFGHDDMVGNHLRIIFTPEDCAQDMPQREIETARPTTAGSCARTARASGPTA